MQLQRLGMQVLTLSLKRNDLFDTFLATLSILLPTFYFPSVIHPLRPFIPFSPELHPNELAEFNGL